MKNNDQVVFELSYKMRLNQKEVNVYRLLDTDAENISDKLLDAMRESLTGTIQIMRKRVSYW